ncbi:TetR family transcriptional regulator [Aneurinibacillus soli]|uniref:Fatty acid metabolism regulator protein n=1 Tax=Aneurinibacillus soli TaxID=1500254 RepID=A0A0U5B3L5_9BACL|nr:TetR/AcrR family transcriptional regulator [Aneurinibacillus soli]PYE57815.1 TetR family transcriptional regulator [Aneurinibacillus soli]BAU26230.1 Fatty acid metabolism regulator protein [Aneurinibacillus soli]
MRTKTKELIFQGALKAFAEKGFNETTMEQIAEICGVAKGTLYYNFSTKEDLYIFVMESGVQHFTSMIRDYIEIVSHDDFRERVIRLTEAHLDFFENQQDFCRLLLSRSWGTQERHHTVRHVLQEYFNLLESELHTAQGQGKLLASIDVKTAASSYFGMVGFTAMRAIIYGQSLDNVALRSSLQSLVLHMMGISDQE